METRQKEHFASSEHQALGPITLPGLPTHINRLPLSKDLALKFGDIIALAGDFFGLANEPIGCGATQEERERRFLAAYQQLAHANCADVFAILARIDAERLAVEKALREGRPPKEGVDEDALIETLTYLNKTQFNYLELAKNNVDHFGEESLRAYQAGHAVAMKEAACALTLADPEKKQQQLLYAYALEAFADHFLTDRFASGHQRVPRRQLNERFGEDIGSLLSLFQHEEDGNHGLSLKTTNGESWMAFGDGHFFDEMNVENRNKAQFAIEAGLADVYRAFLTGKVSEFENTLVAKSIPYTDDANNPAPLFRINAQTKKIEYRHQLDKTHLKESDAIYHEISVLSLPRIFEHFIMHYQQHDHSTMCSLISQVKLNYPPNHWSNFSLFSTDQQDSVATSTRHCQCTII